MNRIDEINAFLKKWNDIIRQNPDVEIDGDTIYRALEEYGFTKEELEKSRSIDYHEQIFPKFIDRYDGSNLLCYCSPTMPHFLQFNQKTFGAHAYKVYLSFNADDIEKCASKIFDFVQKNKIDSASKLADRTRSDDIVLRITKYDDLVKVLDFVNSDPDIIQAHHNTNPFMMRHGIAGLSYDDNISYNNAVGNLVSDFLHSKEFEENTNFAQEFQNYIQIHTQNLVWNGQNLDNHLAENQWLVRRFKTKDGLKNNVGDYLVNYVNVLDLMQKQLNPNFNIIEYNEAKNKYSNENNNDKLSRYFNERPRDLQKTNPKELLDAYIKYALYKYGSIEGMMGHLSAYLKGEPRGITNDMGFRNLFVEKLPLQTLNLIINNDIASYIATIAGYNNPINQTKQSKKFSFSDSVREVMNKIKSKVEKKKQDNLVQPTPDVKRAIVINAITTTLNKYGQTHTMEAVKKVINGNYESITNDNNCRTLLSKLDPREVITIIDMYMRENNINNGLNNLSDIDMLIGYMSGPTK